MDYRKNPRKHENFSRAINFNSSTNTVQAQQSSILNRNEVFIENEISSAKRSWLIRISRNEESIIWKVELLSKVKQYMDRKITKENLLDFYSSPPTTIKYGLETYVKLEPYMNSDEMEISREIKSLLLEWIKNEELIREVWNDTIDINNRYELEFGKFIDVENEFNFEEIVSEMSEKSTQMVEIIEMTEVKSSNRLCPRCIIL